MTRKRSNIRLSSTHLKKGSQALLFRFKKDECGKEKSLADMNGRGYYPEFYPKDLTPGCDHHTGARFFNTIFYEKACLPEVSPAAPSSFVQPLKTIETSPACFSVSFSKKKNHTYKP